MCYYPASLHFGFRPIPESSRCRQSVNRPTDHTDRANLTTLGGPVDVAGQRSWSSSTSTPAAGRRGWRLGYRVGPQVVLAWNVNHDALEATSDELSGQGRSIDLAERGESAELGMLAGEEWRGYANDLLAF